MVPLNSSYITCVGNRGSLFGESTLLLAWLRNLRYRAAAAFRASCSILCLQKLDEEVGPRLKEQDG